MAVDHQRAAVSILLCSPSDLGRAWTGNDDSELTAAKAELAKLPFTDEAKLAAIKLLQDAFQFRPFFKGIADVMKAQLYAGEEPHPPVPMAMRIVNALKQLDQEHPPATGESMNMHPLRRRKRVDRLSRNEGVRLAEAFNALKERRRDDNYAFWAAIHANSCPHHCALFLPWHRAYIFAFEEALRSCIHDDELTLPYWDWLAEPRIPEILNSGPLSCERYTDKTRPAGRRLPNTQEIDRTMALEDFFSFGGGGCQAGSTPGALENYHGFVHTWVGPWMEETVTAACDPIFWLHHANVDRLWMQWQKRQRRELPCARIQLQGIPGGWTVGQVEDALSAPLGYEYIEWEHTLATKQRLTRIETTLRIPEDVDNSRTIELRVHDLRAAGDSIPAALDVYVNSTLVDSISLFGLSMRARTDVTPCFPTDHPMMPRMPFNARVNLTDALRHAGTNPNLRLVTSSGSLDDTAFWVGKIEVLVSPS